MFKNIIKEIPGFRTGTKWKKIFATLIYLSLIILIIGISGVTLRDSLVLKLEFLILVGMPFALITNVGNLRNRLPIFNKKSIKFNVLGAFIAFVIMGVAVSTLNNLKSPQQKQLDLLTDQQSKAKTAARELDSKINKLKDVNKLKLDKADDVKGIRKAYDALTAEQKTFVTKLSVLVSAENKIAELQAAVDKSAEEKKAAERKVASDLDSKINALGDVNKLTLDKADDVKTLRKTYDALTANEKGLVTKLSVLVSAENKINNLQAVAEKAAAEKKAAEEKIAADKAAAEEKAAAKKAASEKAAADYKKWIEGQFSSWNGSHIELVKLVKENLNDPKSFEHVKTVYWDKGDYIIVKMNYRAKNGFGALILQNVTAKADYKTNTIIITSQNN